MSTKINNKSVLSTFFDKIVEVIDDENDKNEFLEHIKNISNTMNLESYFINHNLSSQNVSPSGKRKKDPSEPCKISGYNLFSSCIAKLCKNKSFKFNLKCVSDIWKHFLSKDDFNEIAKQFSNLDKNTQELNKIDIINQLYDKYITDLIINEEPYSRNYDSYRVIRKLLKERNINIDEKLNDMWKRLKSNRDDLDEFFNMYENLHPKFIPIEDNIPPPPPIDNDEDD